MSKVFTIMEGLENMGALRTGGQGSVYKGRRIAPVLSAVKLLPTPIYSEDVNDKSYRNFLNEVEKLRKVNETPNPNVVKILSSGITESGSLPFIEMEYIEGADLCELLTSPHEKIFTVKEVIKLADQLAGALAHCHKVGVKHGDIKSNNVKFNSQTGNYVLLDFGLSIMSDEERRSSMRHAGAIEFMAPEQNNGEMLFQTDIYSYGIILFELLVGTVPFPLHDNGETSRNTVMISHMESPVPDVLALRKQNLPANWTADKQKQELLVPQWLLTTIYKCLEKLPENRYENGMALYEALTVNSLTGNPIGTNIAALTIANEELQMQINQFQKTAEENKRTHVTLSKKVWWSAILLMGVLVMLSLYGLLKKPVTYYSASPTSQVYVPFMLRPYVPKNYIIVANKSRVSDSIHNPAKKTTHLIKKRKHKKKFLGIF